METNNQSSTQAQSTVVLTPESEQHRKKATTAMVLSIIGLALFVLPGLNLVGLVLSIIGLVQSVGNRKFATEHGFEEDGSNKAGFICGLIGVIMGGLSVLVTILAVLLFGVVVASAVSYSAPYVSQGITEAAPFIDDIIEQQIPAVISMISPLMGL